MRTITTLLLLAVVGGWIPVALAQESKLNPITNPTLSELQSNFKSPNRDYSTGPLWTWNDRLTEEQVRGTLRDLAAQHVKQVWVHPRPGLMTPYLSDEWFDRWKEALDEAKKLDMNVWIYDENSYPSGFAGGFVPEALPDSRAYGVTPKEVEKDGKKQIVLEKGYAGQSGWYAGKWHTDIMRRDVTEKFLDITLDAYANVPEIRKEFGKRVPGIFTDEPHLIASRFAWTAKLPETFQKKFGYSIEENAISLAKTEGDWKKVRHNYYQTLLDLFIDNWAKPYFERSEKYGLEFTGHYWEHGWPSTRTAPDNMAMYAWHQRPAIDLLSNSYNGNWSNAQFGNVRSVKELASVANQMGHSRTLSENYGAGGWDLRFEDMKRLGDWSYALGVNTTNEHLSYVTIRGARKRDHPQSFSYHAPWFEGYHVLADYFTRLSYVLSQGRQVNHVLVIEPTTTAWMYQGEPKLNEIGRSFTEFVNALERSQVEYDLGSENIIERHGKAIGKTFFINKASYDLVILPPNTENLNGKTAELLAGYVKFGGKLLVAGELPTRIDGVETKIDLPNVAPVTVEEAVAAAKKRTEEDGISISVEGDGKNVFHHRRQLSDCEIVFICNSNQDKAVIVDINTKKCASFWTLADGQVSNSVRSPSGYHIDLSPSASVVLVLTDNESIKDGFSSVEVVSPKMALSGSETKIRRLDDNVLTLDYVDVKVGNEEKKDIYAWAANRWIFQKHGFGGNPWDNQVQFKDELITKKFPADSGFEATYHFTLSEPLTAISGLSIVIERPDLYRIYCNDTEVKPIPGEWYIDKAFGKIDLSKVAKSGENTVKIVASPMTIEHELEPAYLLGDFAVEKVNKGFVVVPPKPLKLLNNTEDVREEIHSQDIEHVSWLSAGTSDRLPSLEFDFGKEQKIDAIRIWNYNESNLKQRGVKSVEITGLGKIDMPISDGTSSTSLFTSPQTLKTVTFKILSNHNGVSYPLAEGVKPGDDGYVGLSEVQFLVREGGKLVPIKNVTVKASSELTSGSFDRAAKHLVDGSGLGADPSKWGWNRQGMPFYAGKVEYSKTFKIEKSAKRYFVKLNDWYGATAQVVVNSKPAGFVVSAPWTVDVTDFVKQGGNEISVIVYGTPKNLLGPHHNGKQRGSAWPGNFHRAPEHQPNGAAYDTIGYGLFEDFELVEENRK